MTTKKGPRQEPGPLTSFPQTSYSLRCDEEPSQNSTGQPGPQRPPFIAGVFTPRSDRQPYRTRQPVPPPSRTRIEYASGTRRPCGRETAGRFLLDPTAHTFTRDDRKELGTGEDRTMMEPATATAGTRRQRVGDPAGDR